jgi:hypothetical protein
LTDVFRAVSAILTDRIELGLGARLFARLWSVAQSALILFLYRTYALSPGSAGVSPAAARMAAFPGAYVLLYNFSSCYAHLSQRSFDAPNLAA